MQQQASGLTEEDKRSVAKFVTGREFGTSPEPDPQANLCKRPAPPLQLTIRMERLGQGSR